MQNMAHVDIDGKHKKYRPIKRSTGEKSNANKQKISNIELNFRIAVHVHDLLVSRLYFVLTAPPLFNFIFVVESGRCTKYILIIWRF